MLFRMSKAGFLCQKALLLGAPPNALKLQKALKRCGAAVSSDNAFSPYYSQLRQCFTTTETCGGKDESWVLPAQQEARDAYATRVLDLPQHDSELVGPHLPLPCHRETQSPLVKAGSIRLKGVRIQVVSCNVSFGVAGTVCASHEAL